VKRKGKEGRRRVRFEGPSMVLRTEGGRKEDDRL
jgi:hypothetical protein